MEKVFISGTELYTPDAVISNEELVDSYNSFVARYNNEHSSEIAGGSVEVLQE